MVALAIFDLLHQGFRRLSDVGCSIRSLMSEPRRPIRAGTGMDANIFAEGVDFSTMISVRLEGGMKKEEESVEFLTLGLFPPVCTQIGYKYFS